MLDDTPQAVLSSLKPYRLNAHVFARPEGSTLLEVLIDGRVLYGFERTNPYDASPGMHEMVINVAGESVTARAATAEPHEKVWQSHEGGRFSAEGPIVHVENDYAVADVGWPLVIFPLQNQALKPDAWVSVDSPWPVHMFVRRSDASGTQTNEPIDDAV